jgi:hypothetical protein
MGKYPNSGTLFKNDRKREGKKDPDYTGSAEIDNVEYWMDCWVKKPEGKKPFFSLSFRPKQPRGEQQERPAARQYDLNKPRRHSPPPPLNQPAEQSEQKPDADGNYPWGTENQ